MMDVSSQPMISIVTINYNSEKDTVEFLESAKCVDYKNLEIIVVDNASKQDFKDLFEEVYPDVRYLRSEENLGFSGGNNLGISISKGEFIFIVNNDTVLNKDLLTLLITPFFEDETIGVVSPKIKYYDNPEIIQYAGFNPINSITGRTSTIGSNQIDKGQFDTPSFTAGAHGAAMMVKREVLEKVGSLENSFFLYYEEWDWSTRIIKGGYKILYQPNAMILHKESMSVGKSSPMKTYYLTRNRIFYMRRNLDNKFLLILFYIFLTFFTIPKSTIIYVLRREFNHLGEFYKGIKWNFKVPTYL